MPPRSRATTGAVEADGAGGGVQEWRGSRRRARALGDLGLGRHAAVAAEEAPGRHERRHGHVEGAAGLPAPPQASARKSKSWRSTATGPRASSRFTRESGLSAGSGSGGGRRGRSRRGRRPLPGRVASASRPQTRTVHVEPIEKRLSSRQAAAAAGRPCAGAEQQDERRRGHSPASARAPAGGPASPWNSTPRKACGTWNVAVPVAPAEEHRVLGRLGRAVRSLDAVDAHSPAVARPRRQRGRRRSLGGGAPARSRCPSSRSPCRCVGPRHDAVSRPAMSQLLSYRFFPARPRGRREFAGLISSSAYSRPSSRVRTAPRPPRSRSRRRDVSSCATARGP